MTSRSSGRPSRCSTIDLVLGRQRLRAARASRRSSTSACRTARAASARANPAASTANVRASTTRAPCHRVDAEPPPREVGEREPGDDLDVDARAAQQRDACARRPTGCPGTAYTISPCSCAAATTRAAIAAYTVSRSSPRVVEQVERLEREAVARELVDRGMARGAHVAHRYPFERGAGRGQQQVGAGRAEPDHDDAWPAHPPGGRGRRRGGRRRARGSGFSRQVRTDGDFGRRHVEDAAALLSSRRRAPRAEPRVDPDVERSCNRRSRASERALLQRLRERRPCDVSATGSTCVTRMTW